MADPIGNFFAKLRQAAEKQRAQQQPQTRTPTSTENWAGYRLGWLDPQTGHPRVAPEPQPAPAPQTRTPTSTENWAGYRLGWLDPQTGHPRGTKVPEPSPGDLWAQWMREAAPLNTKSLPGQETPEDEGGPRVRELTREEYEELPVLERLAVDYNTALVGARNRDLQLQSRRDPSEQQRESYQEALRQTFGDEASMGQTWNPETLGLLRQLGVERPGGDLADFLGLRAAITDQDRERFLNEHYTKRLRDGGQEEGRGTFVHALVDRSRELEEALARGRQLMQDFGSSAQASRGRLVTNLGGTPETPTRGYGYGDTEIDTAFQVAFHALATAPGPEQFRHELEAFRQYVERGGLDPALFDAYAESRLRAAERSGHLTDEADGAALSPQQFRQLWQGVPASRRKK